MSSELIAAGIPRGLAAIASNPPAVLLRNERAAERFFNFFTANIHDGTRGRW